ncbi:MAG: hypothetical protein E7553_00295 [Ruminococcaceae bacterium]|nr:hypothetical protein [Oscillospiraceae bacterium]
MIKIFLTGDNHIGLKYAGHEQAAVLVEARLSAFDRMVQIANEEQADLFVIAGDLFENTYSVTKRDVTRVFRALSAFRGTVVVLPGNHDYYDRDGKVWQYVSEAVSSMDSVLLLTDFRPYPLEIGDAKVVLYPALCTSLHSVPGENNLGWIRETAYDAQADYRIGIAHGAVEGETIDNEGQYFRMSRRELSELPMDVWLIGHTHVPFPRLGDELQVTSERVFNAGTHVQTDVACNTEGYGFVLELSKDKTVRAKAVQTGNLRFVRLPLTLTADTMEDTLKTALAPLSDRTVVDLVLSGAVSVQEYENRAVILENALARFTEGTYRDHALSRLISKELIESEFPETSFSAGLLTALLDDPKEAQLMYELLQDLKEDA